MIDRVLADVLRRRAAEMPAVAVTGPRQSGKTTLCQAVFPEHAYVSLEPIDTRDWAVEDPRGFLAAHDGRVIFDEVQRAPDLLSYLQGIIDEDPRPGRFVLTGSQHFGLLEGVSQSLAGRVAVLHLLPLSHEEVTRFGTAPHSVWETVWTGGYPRILDRSLDPSAWLADYVATYVQRDVRQVLDVADLDGFTTFVRLVAGRTGQELNLSALGSDAGVSHNTARSWLSVLETSFIVFRVPAWHRNLRKRVVKAPKVHFLDTGLACNLLGIRDPDQLVTHPLRGALFASWVASEILKAHLHRGVRADLSHRREVRGAEVDLIIEGATGLRAVEVKSGATVAPGFTKVLRVLGERVVPELPNLRYQPTLVYGGAGRQTRGDVEIIGWDSLAAVDWADA